MSATTSRDFQTFPLGDFELKSGEVLLNANLAYLTFGLPDKPVVLHPSWYSGCPC